MIAKIWFLYSLDVLIKMFANNVAVLNQQIPGNTNHIHYFQTQLTKLPGCLVLCRQQTRLMKNSLDTHTRFWVHSEWIQP